MPTPASEITNIYYAPGNNNELLDVTTQLVPAPMLNINLEIDYASEESNIVVGYKYIITLNGQATGYRKNIANGSSFQNTNESIHLIRQILTTVGGVLYVVNGDGDRIIVAKGGTLKSLEFSDSQNNWMNYAPYTAQLEFQEVEFLGSTISCNNTFVNNDSLSSEIIDINKYKIKEFKENLSVNMDDSLYSSIRNIGGLNGPLSIENSTFNVQYNVSAVGKHYYIYDNASKLLPAWEQAKNFCQYRLFHQIGRLIDTIMPITGVDDPCSTNMTIPNFDSIEANNQNLMTTLGTNYKVYNETINCATSESDGSFSLTYSAIIKRVSNLNNSLNLGKENTKHTINKKISHTKESSQNIRISIDGVIEGLVEGGLVRSSNSTFTLPNQGNLLIKGDNTTNKYTIAKTHLDSMLDGNDFKTNIKDVLGINYIELGLENVHANCSFPGDPEYPEPAVFNLTHNYHEGTINYNIEYSSDKTCGKNLANISVQVQRPVKVYATFPVAGPIPDGQVGTILQDLGTVTAQRINISIQGRSDANMYCCDRINNPDPSIGLFNFETLCHDIVLPPNFILPDPTLYVLTEKSKQTNVIDGSYTINLGYILTAGGGCL